jgi:uncharacterized membrane protein
MDTKPNAAPGRPGVSDLRVEPTLAAPRGVVRSIRDRIIGGLLLVMPLLITLWIFSWLYTFLEKKVIDPLVGLVLWKLKWTTSSTDLPYWFETYAAPVIAIILALVLLYCLDLLADTRLRRAVGWFLASVPVISHVYNPVRKMFQSLDQQPEQPSKQRIVLIKFPHPGVKLPAIVTAACRDIETQKVLLCVYAPTTPVPTSGYFLLVPEEEVTELNWTSEQTLQAIMSGGLTAPPEVSYFGRRFADAINPPASLVSSEVPPRPPDDGRPPPA